VFIPPQYIKKKNMLFRLRNMKAVFNSPQYAKKPVFRLFYQALRSGV